MSLSSSPIRSQDNVRQRKLSQGKITSCKATTCYDMLRFPSSMKKKKVRLLFPILDLKALKGLCHDSAVHFV